MVRTRGAKSSSPLGRKRAAKETPVQGSTSEPPRPLVIPPPIEDASMSPPVRRYQTRSGGLPPKKKARVSDSEPIDLTEPSPESSPEPPSELQPSQPPPTESQIPSSMTPEVLIRRPMVAQPPIEGNLDCQTWPFHSELCFDIATFRLQPELRDSFHLLHRYHMEHLLTLRDFFIDHFSEHPYSGDDSSSCSSGVDFSHLDSAYCHSEADSAPSGYSISS
ncbi:hypothetical protein CK203_115178 [Vitis vinifera]|uniref:Uncharacterized protein n=1 Tax=Vitis vinifera TaxID=29760 RepID=A0A438C403_VITVI|nr:hypothetical protein CK203_115178 [Vitis vinifera]